MHYDPRIRGSHGLPHSPFNAIVSPRPIGWISTLGKNGQANIAPYSFFNAVSSAPPIVMFSSFGPKDTVENATREGEFVVNIASYELREAMNESSAVFESQVSEAETLGIEMAASLSVKTPRVMRSPAALECKFLKTVSLTTIEDKAVESIVVIGQVTGIYINDDLISEGRYDIVKASPLARLGYYDYTAVTNIFEMRAPASTVLSSDRAPVTHADK